MLIPIHVTDGGKFSDYNVEMYHTAGQDTQAGGFPPLVCQLSKPCCLQRNSSSAAFNNIIIIILLIWKYNSYSKITFAASTH